MKFSWGDSIFFAFLWASVWAGALTCYVLDWKVEWMQPKLWFLYVKKKLNKSKSIFFKATKISQKVLNPFETVLSALEDGNIQNSSVNIGQSYRQKIEHEMKLLQANDITHEIRIAYAKLPEANKKNHDFKHWNDAGREWREAILQGTVSNRYRNKKSGKILYEDFFPHGAILLRQSRHIRHDEVESKNRNEEQQFYSEYQKIMCPSCGAEISLKNNQKIIKKDKKMELKLYRARHPRRMKSKGQAVFSEKECPSCGANFMPDKNGCCSYCGYQLTVDNSKWRLVNL